MTLHHDGLARAKALQPSGCCAFCEEPLPIRGRGRGRPNTVTCGSRDCTLAMMRAWHRDDNGIVNRR